MTTSLNKQGVTDKQQTPILHIFLKFKVQLLFHQYPSNKKSAGIMNIAVLHGSLNHVGLLNQIFACSQQYQYGHVQSDLHRQAGF